MNNGLEAEELVASLRMIQMFTVRVESCSSIFERSQPVTRTSSWMSFMFVDYLALHHTKSIGALL